jgi:hypothetical protein
VGLVENVVLLPFGVPIVERCARGVENEEFTISTYGFALPGKGLPELVEAMALLREGGVKVRLLMVNADYGDEGGVSLGLLGELRDSIERFGLEEHVESHTGFLRDEESLALISQGDVVVFPYTKTGESGSAAVRLGLASGRLVATTPLPIFDDVKDAVYQLPGVSARHIAQGLKALFGKLAAQDAEIEQLLRRSEHLVEATRYPEVSRFLDERMRTDIYLNCFTEALRLNRNRVLLRNASWVRGRIVSKGSGVICYGPYAPLSPGIYRVVVKGALRTGREQAVLRLRTAEETFATFELKSEKDDILADFLVVLPKAVSAVELVIDMQGAGVVTINDYLVSKKWR